jgi:hypothetical protein
MLALAPDGALVLVGYFGPLGTPLNTAPMVFRGKSLAGSLIGGLKETQDMLDFCGEHGITSDVEVIRIQDINAAYECTLKSDVKYRFVIDLASLKSEREPGRCGTTDVSGRVGGSSAHAFKRGRKKTCSVISCQG